MQNNNRKGAFTLIELSIVLVIIGLLAAGVLTGKDLIKAAEIRATISDLEKFKTAVATFMLKYNCLPGDCQNATDYFGIAGGTGIADDSTVATGTNFGSNDAICSTALNSGSTGTCNGNGDGSIGYWNGTYPMELEAERAWQQLGLANLISGKFSGTNPNFLSGDYCDDRGGVNVPAGHISGTAYSFGYTSPNNGWLLPSFSGNFITFGYGQNGDKATHPAITAMDAQNIDTKLDDGKPDSGWVQGMPSAASGVTTNIYTPNCLDISNKKYDIINTNNSSTAIVCALVIKVGL